MQGTTTLNIPPGLTFCPLAVFTCLVATLRTNTLYFPLQY